MNVNFELLLFYAVVITGIISLVDVLLFARKRQHKKIPLIIDYARSFFPVLLLVFLLRSFLYEPFRIPSSSLEPTLLTGDFILVNKYDYGIRLPVIHEKLFGSGVPERGDIIVFRWPPNPSIDFIKRVIGVPGDRISYVDKTLYINGKKIPQSFLKSDQLEDEMGNTWRAVEKEEDLLGVKHHIYVDDTTSGNDYHDIVVPEGMYFVMGDNRDHSADSRWFGFVPDKNIIGKAVLVWMSWNGAETTIRWKRMGSAIH